GRGWRLPATVTTVGKIRKGGLGVITSLEFRSGKSDGKHKPRKHGNLVPIEEGDLDTEDAARVAWYREFTRRFVGPDGRREQVYTAVPVRGFPSNQVLLALRPRSQWWAKSVRPFYANRSCVPKRKSTPSSNAAASSSTAPALLDHPVPNMLDYPGLNMLNYPGPSMLGYPEPSMLDYPGPNMLDYPGPNMLDYPGPNMLDYSGPNMLNYTGPSVLDYPEPNMLDYPGPSMLDYPGPS
ncbi:hypothetical protein GNI_171500, partial [Gregarina niphandrodes]